jgi:hypothetical protein
VSAAWAYGPNADVQTPADEITATYGFVNGQNNVTVTVNTPAKSGNFQKNKGYTCTFYPCSIEVIVTQKQAALFSRLSLRNLVNNLIPISARAVAIAPMRQCVLALDPNASGAVNVEFLAAINLTDCGLFTNSSSSSSINVAFLAAIKVTDGTVGTVGNVSKFLLGSITPNAMIHQQPILDPYQNISTPVPVVPAAYSAPSPTCSGVPGGSTVTTSKTLTSGVNYCGPITVNNGGTLTASNNTFTGGIAVNNHGNLIFNSGTYNVNGSITAASGGQVTLNSGTYTLNGSITNSGQVTANPGTYTLYGGISNSGTFTSTSGTYTMTLTGGIANSSGNLTLSSGTYTSSGITLTGGTLTGNSSPSVPATYILNSNSTSTPMLTVNDSTLTGTGVTLVFTTSNGKYPNQAMTITSSTINLTAPTTGPTADFVMFGNNSSGTNAMPVGTTFIFDFFSSLKATGAVYLPKGYLTFAGIAGSTDNCTQMIADKIDFIAIAGLGDSCGNLNKLSLSISGVPQMLE